MGCGTAREKLEDKMMVYKLERMEIQMEKEKELKKLAEIEGHTIERNRIPDYIDPQFAKEKRLYEVVSEEDKENNKSENNDKSSKKNNHNKKNNKKKQEEKPEKKKKKKK